MPQYVALIYGAENPNDEGTPEEQQQMMNEYMEFGRTAESVLRGGEALNYTSTAKTVHVEGGKGGSLLVTDGPFAETKDLVAGWMVIDVETYERAIELAGELSAAPGAGGKPIHEWLEVRPAYGEQATATE